MLKICILIRVYDRLDDLKYCLQLINDTWLTNDYYILVVCNGVSKGYIVNQELEKEIDYLLVLEENAGHLKGNAQLLTEGLKFIPYDTAYTIILEADTWIYTDSIINKYIKQLEETKAVWASAQWYTTYFSLATDFAILDHNFLKLHPLVFNYTGYPECYAANYINDNDLKYVYIKENMPVHLPNYLKKYVYAPAGRFNVFVRSKMVTHHTEQYKNGISTKKAHLNRVAGKAYFTDIETENYNLQKSLMSFLIALVNFLPRKSWFLKTQQFNTKITHANI
ncbi:hypothetical protein I5M32_14090 [Pedobacter sp. SD-b]|uniref:Glycosyl transferase family 2 n=1 Tax=Pedobacter segetis TaxID=2793069 RepID=A0ABS1BMX9_9SPHI|nr:hypothetical protein [Pedobacter segetis]MBK0384096.1 hypothetical protein [Pedobacter segetis]